MGLDMKYDTILVIDDDVSSRQILTEIFRDKYKILEACNGREGIELLRTNAHSIAVVLLDNMMPVMNGFQMLEKLGERKLLTKIPFIMITSEDSPESEKMGYEHGVMSYIKKPYQSDVVRQVVENVVDLFQYKMLLEVTVKSQTEKLKKQNQILRLQAKRMKYMNEILVDSMSNLVEFRNLESKQHIKRTRLLSVCLGTSVMKLYPEYALTAEKLEMIGWASSLHDIGKIVIPDSILLKPGKLTADEYEVIKSHTTKGAEIIEKIIHIQDKDFYDYTYDIARHHHEKYDGSGYPDELKGENISIAAQIVSLVDVYDALTSKRVYKAAYDTEKAYQIIVNGQSGAFSSKLVQAFIEVRTDMESIVNKYNSD